MSRADKYLELKKQVDAAQKKADKAQGAYDQIKKQLKSEFGCSSIVEAEKLLKKLNKQEKELGKEFDDAYQRYTKEWDNEE